MTTKQKYWIIGVLAFAIMLLSFLLFFNRTAAESQEVTEEAVETTPEPTPEPTPTPCQHEWIEGTCALCQKVCPHEEFDESGVCKNCGFRCKHAEYEDGVCTLCGYVCNHDYENGICNICGKECEHPNHDYYTQACTECGMVVSHRYVDNKCVCGKEFAMDQDLADLTMWQPCEHQGKYEEVMYETPRYDGDINKKYYKWMAIYTPYDYDPSRKYNVIFMYHGRGANHTTWVNTDEDIGDQYLVVKNIYDNMIERKMCEPFILVSLSTGYLVDGYIMHDNSVEQNALELRNIVFPHIIQLYSTYAESSAIEDIQKAREHFAIGGCSNGSLFAFKSGMMQNFDLIANYLFISGSATTEAKEVIMSDEFKDLPFKCFFCAGSYDSQLQRMTNGYNEMLEVGDRMVPGSTIWFMVTNGGHDLRAFYVGFYNGIQVMF